MILLGAPPYIAINSWQAVPLPIESVAFAVLFKDFESGSPTNWVDIKSSLWCRRSTKITGLEYKEKVFKFYPVDQLSLQVLPPLPLSIVNNASECSLEFIKIFRFKNYTYVEPNYKLEFYAILA